MIRNRAIISAAVFAFAAAGVPTHACVNPADQWAAGVVWSGGEAVNFTSIEQLGEEGTGFFRAGSVDTPAYIFRSHYAPQHAVVYLGYFTLSYQTDVTVPRLAVILDTLQDAGAFDFAAAVRVELDWLTDPELGVVEMSMGEKRAAEDSLKAAGTGGVQYWTRQQGVLPYNQWYTEEGEGGVFGVNGVRGACGLDVAFDMPSQALSSAALHDTFMIYFGDVRLGVTNISTNETRMVSAVRELNGSYYMPFMSRLPTFMNNSVCGYFDADSIELWPGSEGKIFDTVFIITEIIGQASSIAKAGAAVSIPDYASMRCCGGLKTADHVLTVRGEMISNQSFPRGAVNGIYLVKNHNGAINKILK